MLYMWKKIALIFVISFNLFADDYPYESRIPEKYHNSLHFIIPAVSSYAVSYSLGKIFPKNKLWQNVSIGATIGVAEGFSKELFDYYKGYPFSINDLTLAFAGAILSEGVFILVYF